MVCDCSESLELSSSIYAEKELFDIDVVLTLEASPPSLLDIFTIKAGVSEKVVPKL